MQQRPQQPVVTTGADSSAICGAISAAFSADFLAIA